MSRFDNLSQPLLRRISSYRVRGRFKMNQMYFQHGKSRRNKANRSRHYKNKRNSLNSPLTFCLKQYNLVIMQFKTDLNSYHTINLFKTSFRLRKIDTNLVFLLHVKAVTVTFHLKFGNNHFLAIKYLQLQSYHF